MAFHLTAVWDFKSREVMVISSSEDKTFWLETQGLSAKHTNTQPLMTAALILLERTRGMKALPIYFHDDCSWVLNGMQMSDKYKQEICRSATVNLAQSAIFGLSVSFMDAFTLHTACYVMCSFQFLYKAQLICDHLCQSKVTVL